MKNDSKTKGEELTFLDLIHMVNLGFLYIQVMKANKWCSTNTSKNVNLLSFSSSILKVKEGCKSFKQSKNDKASLQKLEQVNVISM